MSETGKQLVPVQKNTLAVIRKQLDITDRLLKERALALTPDVFNVPADGTFEEAVQRVRPDGLISIAAGRYVLETGVKITKPLRIKGAGRDVTVIESTFDGVIVAVDTEGMFSIEDIKVEKTGEKTDDLLLIRASTTTVKSCFFVGNGIRPRELTFEDIVADTPSDPEDPDNDYLYYGWCEGYIPRFRHWHGIEIAGATVGIIENTEVTGCEYGIEISGNANVELRGNKTTNNLESGIIFSDESSSIAENNISVSNMRFGIVVGNNNLFEACTFYEYGISHFPLIHDASSCKSKVILANNRCENNESDGIVFAGYSSGDVKNNLCKTNKGSGISIRYNAKICLSGNICEGNDFDGIRMGGELWQDSGGGGEESIIEATGNIKNNICRFNQRNGITVGLIANANICGNLCEENGGDGFTMRMTGNYSSFIDDNTESPITVVENNFCKMNKGAGLSVECTANTYVTSNCCEENGSYGVNLESNNKVTLERNISKLNGLAGINVGMGSSHEEAVLIGNKCEENSGAGISWNYNSNGTAENNVCSQNLGGGIWVSKGSNVELEGNNCSNNEWFDIQFEEGREEHSDYTEPIEMVDAPF